MNTDWIKKLQMSELSYFECAAILAAIDRVVFDSAMRDEYGTGTIDALSKMKRVLSEK